MSAEASFDLRASVLELLNRQPAVGLAFGVVRRGRLEFFHGHGVADLETREPIGEDTIFRIASITKTFTAIAVMQLCERGLVDLDGSVNDYLRAYRLAPARAEHRAPTVRELLTHTGGLGEVVHARGLVTPDFGESVPVGEPVPSLAEYYGGELRLKAEPGTRFVYGNHSFATLGQLVEDVSGEAFDQYLRAHIFEPLGMGSTDLLRSDLVRSRLASGYEIGSGGAKRVADREMVTAGSASIYSSPRDMARYVAALLGGGANEHGSVLRPETLRSMFEAQYQPDPRIPGMGLGFWRAEAGGHLIAQHQGSHPGFHSQLAVAPDDGVGVMAFTNGAREADFWLPPETNRLLAGLLGVRDQGIRSGVPHRPEVWDDISGWYSLQAALTDLRLRVFLGAGIEVFVRDGRPMMRLLTPIPRLARGLPLLPDDPDDPYSFRVDLLEAAGSAMRVVFGQDEEGRTDRLCLDLMPLRFEKQPAALNPRRLAAGAMVAGVGAMALGVGSLLQRRLSAGRRGRGRRRAFSAGRSGRGGRGWPGCVGQRGRRARR